MAKIISVHSYRGGTGKSNITANLAATIAQQGKRVGVIDTDIQSPGIHLIFGMDDTQMERALNDYLWGNCSIEEAAYDVSAVIRTEVDTSLAGPSLDGTIYLIPSSLKAGEITRVLRDGYDVGLLNDGFRALVQRLNLDYLLIDTHPGLNEETLLSLAISNTLVVIMRPDHQDYQGTAVTIDVARKLDVPRLLVVLNKVLSTADQDDLRQQVESTYEATVAAIMPLNEEMIRLGSRGIFCLRHPDHPISATIRAIAAQVCQEDS